MAQALVPAAPRLVSALATWVRNQLPGLYYKFMLAIRRLPHQYPEGKWLFATWHLHGSLPHARYPPPHKLSSGQAFVWMDRYLDTTDKGAMYLRLEPIAQIVVD